MDADTTLAGLVACQEHQLEKDPFQLTPSGQKERRAN